MPECARSVTTRSPRPSATSPPLVVVMSEHQLMRDTVRTALHSLRFATTSLSTPATADQFKDLRPRLARMRPAAGVLICDLRGAANLHRAAAVINGLDLDWVVLANVRPGLIWGAILDAGAAAVLEATVHPQELADTLDSMTAKRPAPTSDAANQVAQAWRNLSPRQRHVLHCIAALSPKEMEVLVALYEGDPVQVIARRSGVSESTVRSQVRSLLRKLDASSQIQAVATYREANEWLNG